MKAKIASEYLTIQNFHRFDGVWFAECDCNDYDEFRSLPSVIEVQGNLLGKSAWNSDRGVACYRDNKIVGKIP